ncbi:MAG: polysaccharide deacetylase family protein [Marinobacter sp.]|uniref:polysaccharide deacetylase family protein n=1 Tax=Marinobacter sp. TaxID=50741 RepID=UPI00299D3930|nr:polysaccharide deacetylase family protein [Marinobacter sp.]MDX1754885.1 polysaccharide deacetylase family protein [Marinobacter sp.]
MNVKGMMYRVARPFGVLEMARFLSRTHPRILMYHRISPDGAPGTIGVTQFREQIRLIKKSFVPMGMDEMFSAFRKGRLPNNLVVVTFDDGYHDFAEHAFPVLQECGVPATLFLTTGFVNGELWLWPDLVRYAIEETDLKQLAVTQLGETLDFEHHPDQAWHTVCDHCLLLDNRQKIDFVDNFCGLLNVSIPREPVPEFRAVTWPQVRGMVEKGLEVGSHTVSHPILTKLDPSTLRFEIESSRDTIAREIGVPPKGFCYPNGMPTDFDDAVKDTVRDAGYEYALSAFPGSNPMADRWAINRYPANSEFATFEKKIYGLEQLIG